MLTDTQQRLISELREMGTECHHIADAIQETDWCSVEQEALMRNLLHRTYIATPQYKADYGLAAMLEDT